VSGARVYRINQIGDFLAVPRGRRARMLAEFLVALERAEFVVVWMRRLAREKGLVEPTAEDAIGEFVWRDDGDPTVTLSIVPEAGP